MTDGIHHWFSWWRSAVGPTGIELLLCDGDSTAGSINHVHWGWGISTMLASVSYLECEEPIQFWTLWWQFSHWYIGRRLRLHHWWLPDPWYASAAVLEFQYLINSVYSLCLMVTSLGCIGIGFKLVRVKFHIIPDCPAVYSFQIGLQLRHNFLASYCMANSGILSKTRQRGGHNVFVNISNENEKEEGP